MSTEFLKPITRISPSMAVRLQRCPLEAIYSCNTSSNLPAVTGTAARIGTACHQVLEAIASDTIPPTADWDSAFQELWTAKIGEQEQEVMNSPYERHFGTADRWRNIAMQRARLKRLARTLWEAQQQSGLISAVERRYQAFDGRLIGIADVVRETPDGLIIEDYKTGTIIEVDEETGTSTLMTSYREQMLLYAAMHHNVYDIWPVRGKLIPLDGDSIDVPIDSTEATQLVINILHLADQTNKQITDGIALEQLGKPGIETCQYCSYQVKCPAFWRFINNNLSWKNHAIEGVILEATRSSDGTILARVQIISGSLQLDTISVVGNPCFAADQLLLLQGESVKITSLRAKQNRYMLSNQSRVLKC